VALSKKPFGSRPWSCSKKVEAKPRWRGSWASRAWRSAVWPHDAAAAACVLWAPRKRGRRFAAKDQAMVRRLVVDRTPDQFKMPFYLWIREAVDLLIEQRTGLKFSVWRVGRFEVPPISWFERFRFPAALRSVGVTRLPRYYGGSDCCRRSFDLLHRQLSHFHGVLLPIHTPTNHVSPRGHRALPWDAPLSAACRGTP
jgi:hypothetical protein